MKRFNSQASHAAYYYGAEIYRKGYEAALNDLYVSVSDEIDDQLLQKLNIRLLILLHNMREHLESYKEKS